MAVLTITGLTRTFGDVVANDAVDLTIRPGEVVGLLGHNGAGKTTLVSQIVGLLAPDAGGIEVAGIDAVADPAAARQAVALQAQAQAPLDGLTPRTAIEIAGRLRGLSKSAASDAAKELANMLDIGEWIDRRATPDGGGISGGVRRLTAYAMAVAAPMPLVVLDEPTNDVDASRRRRLWDHVRSLADRGSGVLLVTHNVVEAERVVDELVVLDRGRVVAAGTPAEVRGTHDNDLRLELTLHPGGDEPADPPFVISRRVRSGRRILLTIAPTDAEAAVAWAGALHAAESIESYALAPATLEDAYLAATAATSTSEVSETSGASGTSDMPEAPGGSETSEMPEASGGSGTSDMPETSGGSGTSEMPEASGGSGTSAMQETSGGSGTSAMQETSGGSGTSEMSAAPGWSGPDKASGV